MVALHKEQFGRGPTKAQSHLAGADALLCVMEDALLPAERTMVEMGEQQRVREARMFLQVATADQFVAAVERITGRTVRAFASATDPDMGSSWRTSSSSPTAHRTAAQPTEADRRGPARETVECGYRSPLRPAPVLKPRRSKLQSGSTGRRPQACRSRRAGPLSG
jgi:uncharacterized protein YbcI